MHTSLSLLGSLAYAASVSAASNDSTYWPWQSYKSVNFEPPSLNITKSGDPTSPGLLFFDQNGPYRHNYSLFIMTDDNELVWQSEYGDYTDFQTQTFEGEPVLTAFQGVTFSEPFGWGYGAVHIWDQTYNNTYNVSLLASDGPFGTITGWDFSGLVSWIDMHEAHITDDDTLLVTMYNVSQTDLTSVGGSKDGWSTYALFFEIDIKTNNILFQWSSLDHVDKIPIVDSVQFHPVNDWGQNQSYPYEYFHINSVDKLKDGGYIISSRYFSSIFKIAADGEVQWTFQGKTGGDFKLLDDISFRYQHDARVRAYTENGMDISFFNNDNAKISYGINETTGLYVSLNEKTMEASLIKKLVDPTDTIYAQSQGNVQHLDDGHAIMGYGSTPKIKEYNAEGTCVMTAQFGRSDGTVFSYRAYRSPWVGLPTTTPDVYACWNKSNKTEVYMSWNGATEHQQWNVYSGSSKKDLKLAGKAKKTGFETKATIPDRAKYVRVEASGKGIETGASELIAPVEEC